ECRIGQEKFLRLRQMDESLDVQIRHGGTLSNWAVRRIGRVGFKASCDKLNCCCLSFSE
ncbi:hypothetical protein IAF53_20685, partial [Acinetobacter baumannii]|nr:hypothetical protein [Acinetobacter baumannii]